MKTPQHQHSSFASQWAVDDLLELSDIQSLNKKEQFELGELEWLADIGLFGDQLPQEALAHTDLPMPLKKPRIEIPDDDDEYFMVPDLG
ncbi:B-box zinc finger protein 25-like [Hibiscus syriacus]|nr:B-box zinc finger protein 25-like [Hibiscus syriacus]